VRCRVEILAVDNRRGRLRMLLLDEPWAGKIVVTRWDPKTWQCPLKPGDTDVIGREDA
jgi:hypothetical protein